MLSRILYNCAFSIYLFGICSTKGQSAGPVDFLSNLFCECERCCNITEFNFAASDSVLVPSHSLFPVIWPLNGEEYGIVVGWELNRQLTNFAINTNGSVTCDHSKAHVTNKAETMTPATVKLKQDGETSCIVDWDGIFQDSFAYSTFTDIVVYFAFQSFSTEDRLAFLTPDLMHEIVTQYDLQRPLFATDVFSPVQVDGIWEVQLSIHYFNDATDCPFPAFFPLTLGTCSGKRLRRGSSSITSATYSFTPTLSELDTCAVSREPKSDHLIYTIPLVIDEVATQLNSRCPTNRPIFLVNSTEFYMRVRTNLDGSTSVEGLSNVKTKLVDYEVAEPCNDLFTEQAYVSVYLETKLSDARFQSLQPAEKIKLSDALLELDQSSVACQQAGIEHTCTYRYLSTNCVLMSNYENNGLTTCTFENLGLIRASVKYTRTDSSMSKDYEFSETLPEKTFTSCASPAQKEIFNSEFPVTVSEISASSSMNDPLVVEMKFSDASMGPESSTTLKIYQIRVSGGGVTRNFLVDTKVALMGSPSSPYYSDAHFCRYEPQGSPSCEPFYSTFSNALTLSEASTYGVAGKGHRSCQRVNLRNIDRFIFTPTSWPGFQQLISETSVTFQIQVFASLDTCGFSSSAGARVLQTHQLKVVNATFEMVFNNLTPSFGQQPGSSSHSTAIIAGSLGGAFCICCAGFIFLFFRRRHRHTSSGKPHEQLTTISYS